MYSLSHLVLIACYFFVACKGYGDTSSNPALSCQDVLLYGNAVSGTYWITYGSDIISVWCDFTTTPGQAWTMVYKISAGAGGNPVAVWNGLPLNHMTSIAANTGLNLNYRNGIIDNWSLVQKVAVNIYVNTTLAAQLLFTPGTTNNNWFGPDYLLSSPWGDAPTVHGWDGSAQGRYFSLVGDPGDSRAWYINNNWGGCPEDYGWLIVSYAQETCPFYGSDNVKPAILFSTAGVKANWETTGQSVLATSFVVLVQMQEPLTIPAWSTTAFTFYIGNNTNLTSLSNTTGTNALCRFDTLIVPANVANSTIKCYTPPVPGGIYGFSYSIDGFTWYATSTELLVRSVSSNPIVQDTLNNTQVNFTWAVDPSMGSSIDVHLLLYFTSSSLDRPAPGLSSLMLIDAGVLFNNIPNDGKINFLFPTIDSTVVAAYALAVVPAQNSTSPPSSRKRFDSNTKYIFDKLVDKTFDKLVDYIKEAGAVVPKPLLKIVAVGRAVNAIGATVEAITEYCHGTFCGNEYLCSEIQDARTAAAAPEDVIDGACKNLYLCQQQNILDDSSCEWAYRRDLSLASYDNSCAFSIACQVSGFYHFVASFTIDPILNAVGRSLEVDTDIPKQNAGSGGGWGDVHYTSWDGCFFTFNGVGDYTLIEAATTSLLYYDFVMQVRTHPFAAFPSAALTAAVAIQGSAISTPIALYPSNNDAAVYLDGLALQINIGTQFRFMGGSIKKTAIGVFTLDFDSGFTVTLATSPVAPDFFWQIAISVPPTAFNRTRGILGVWDLNPSNDFLLSDGTQFLCGQQINEFGSSWAIRNNTSLFYTVNSTSPTPVGNVSFTPASDPVFSTPEEQARAQALCGGLPAAMQAGCLFDVSVMNVTGIANATGLVSQTFSALSTVPSNISIVYISNVTCSLSWNLPSGTPSLFSNNVTYDVSILYQDVWNDVPYAGNVTVATASHLVPNTTYSIKIRAVFQTGDVSSWSQTSFTTLACVPLCDSTVCGLDGCGGMCTCLSFFMCDSNYTCILSPTASPTSAPTSSPTAAPSASPSSAPTNSPSITPTRTPTNSPSITPTRTPTISPTNTPTKLPTVVAPTEIPTSPSHTSTTSHSSTSIAATTTVATTTTKSTTSATSHTSTNATTSLPLSTTTTHTNTSASSTTGSKEAVVSSATRMITSFMLYLSAILSFIFI